MKYLLFFLIPINVFAYSYSDINMMKVNCAKGEANCITTIYQLMDRVANGCEFSVSPPVDEFDIRSIYERMVMVSCVKPTFDSLLAELALYKTDQTALEDSRLAEIARIKGLKDRFKALTDIRLAMQKCGYIDPNIKIMMKKIIKSKDNTKLDCLESKEAEVAIDISVELQKKSDRTFCKNQLKTFDVTNISDLQVKPLLKCLILLKRR